MALGGAAVGVGVTLVMVSGGSAVADGVPGRRIAGVRRGADWSDGDTVAEVVPLSPPPRIINVPATATSSTMPATLATQSQRLSS